MKIPITQPYFGEEEKQRIQQPLDSGWVVQGAHVETFEDKFCEFTSIPHGVATTSCTTAMELCMELLNVGPGDEVIMPAFTWVSTPNVVEHQGGTPVFCDVNLGTFNLDPEEIERHITENTVGIYPVHLFGLAADMDPILDIAEDHDLWVAEDAACGFGARYRGDHVGAIGDLGAFSFHPRKSITTGEGGMVTTQDPDFARQARSLRDHGATKTDRERHSSEDAFLLADYPRIGYNHRMTDLQGAVGSVQMDRGEDILASRREQATLYDDLLEDADWIHTPTVPDGYEHGYQTYVTLFAPEEPTLNNVDRLYEKRNAVMRDLAQQGIATRQGTHAAALQEVYVEKYGHQPEDFPRSHIAEKVTLALPMYHQLSDEEQRLVVDRLTDAFEAL